MKIIQRVGAGDPAESEKNFGWLSRKYNFLGWIKNFDDVSHSRVYLHLVVGEDRLRYVCMKEIDGEDSQEEVIS